MRYRPSVVPRGSLSFPVQPRYLFVVSWVDEVNLMLKDFTLVL
jgi:hypothetical protein